MKLSSAVYGATIIGALRPVSGFQPVQQPFSTQAQSQITRQHPSTKLFNQLNQFDVSKPVFDLFSLRTIRGDAIIRYDATNQSEPIRIQLYAASCLLFLASPTLAEALDFDPLTLPGRIATVAVSVLSGGLFVRECKKRSNQLNRIEKELNTEGLPIRLPTNALSDQRYTKPIVLKQLRASKSIPPRVLALYGEDEKLKDALKGLWTLGKRLEQASVYVVCIPTVGSSFRAYEWVLEQQSSMDKTIPWLADAYDEKAWRSYFKELTPEDTINPSFLWFGLNSNGRSIGSGANEVPTWLQLLGQHFRPTMDDFELMDAPIAVASSEGGEAALSQSVQDFYAALTTGNKEAMDGTLSKTESSQVSEVLNAGGRVDSWTDCLADGARPEGMEVSNAEVIIVSDTEAYTTVIESPANTGLDSATLLAVQEWTRSSSEKKWELALHQTIPWDAANKAQGTLRCDCRGCVALTRTPERQTFGGLIG
ncbi:unnamed protein product [Cylindrotheca closterium]|uniref:Uncharacterized protein n=1 Tax=Cylindrotheca closterium TaxID=2856 RepID=A0AAD2CMT1_9STRA|nr:unnamed protein product [Cylindrotheca closterium]